MTSVLIFFALGFGLLGLLFLSQATAGVGLIAFGCLIGICARIAQASQSSATTAPAVAQVSARRDIPLYVIGSAVGILVLVSFIAQSYSDQIINLFVSLFG